MASYPKQFCGEAGAQQLMLSLFLRGERQIFRGVAGLVPKVKDAEDTVQQTNA